ncbi:hypothetical protein CWO85_00220 [Candidatus Phytoplasma ziziphi]|uniref:Uncharacterized protein n=1 Tax=Ziziphus jujuba witches'-broom phytoplasma TaxID=135727 RepID=A0A660HLU1_ZIZJU|nr:hypothetical protein CWO85_00220 [Candidatus Phytoplasma ziziphi]
MRELLINRIKGISDKCIMETKINETINEIRQKPNNNKFLNLFMINKKIKKNINKIIKETLTNYVGAMIKQINSHVTKLFDNFSKTQTKILLSKGETDDNTATQQTIIKNIKQISEEYDKIEKFLNIFNDFMTPIEETLINIKEIFDLFNKCLLIFLESDEKYQEYKDKILKYKFKI